MNKTSIYALSVVIIAVVAFSIIFPGIRMIENFTQGFAAGLEASSTETTVSIPFDITFHPNVDRVINSPDSIVFADGTEYPLVINHAAVCIPESRIPTWSAWVSILCYLASFVLLIILIWKFIRFIINISREEIFIDSNARYLRHFSFCLIAIAIFQIISGLSEEYVLSTFNLRLAGYELTGAWSFPWSNLLIGLVSLLISIVWARGILIKKEQELTI